MSIELANFDTIYKAIYDILKAYSESEPEEWRFSVERDFFRESPPREPGAYLFLRQGDISPNSGKSASRKHYNYTCQYYVEAITIAAAEFDPETSELTRGDIVAADRLRYLILQVWDALFHGERSDLGQGPGVISGRPFMGWQWLDASGIDIENAVAGALGTMELGMVYEPGGVDGPDLQRISVKQDFPEDWEAYFDPDQYNY